MKNPFKTLLRAQRQLRARKPLSAAMTLGKLFAPPKPKRKPPKPAVKKPKPRLTPAKPTTAPKVQPRRPKPSSFVEGRQDSSEGGLAYWLYVPAGSALRRLPLVVMLHGCGQSAPDFALGTGMNAVADELGFLVLYPQQSSSANLARCWNWFRPGDQKRGGGEPAAIAALTRKIITSARADPARVYIAGLSAGGAAAANIGAAYPDLFAAIGVHSGLLRGDVTTASAALSAMRNGPKPASQKPVRARTPWRSPTIVFHGDQDTTVHPSNATAFVDQLKRASAQPLTDEVEQGRSASGRAFTRISYWRAGEVLLEEWTIRGAGHAWSGGSAAGSYTDPKGPDASREMARFFLARRRASLA